MLCCFFLLCVQFVALCTVGCKHTQIHYKDYFSSVFFRIRRTLSVLCLAFQLNSVSIGLNGIESVAKYSCQTFAQYVRGAVKLFGVQFQAMNSTINFAVDTIFIVLMKRSPDAINSRFGSIDQIGRCDRCLKVTCGQNKKVIVSNCFTTEFLSLHFTSSFIEIRHSPNAHRLFFFQLDSIEMTKQKSIEIGALQMKCILLGTKR